MRGPGRPRAAVSEARELTLPAKSGRNEIGVVAMAGPGVFPGYLNEVHNRTAFVEPGWVNSGDLGRIDHEGSLWITGREKDLIIRGSHNIDPAAIEEVFFQHPDVALAAVVGEPGAYAGELPVAFVQPRSGVTVDTAALMDFVRERTPERAAVRCSCMSSTQFPRPRWARSSSLPCGSTRPSGPWAACSPT